MLSLLQLSYDMQKKAVKSAHTGFISGDWSKKNVDCYLRAHGLNNDAIHSVIDCATNTKLFRDIDTDPEELADPDKAALYQQIVANRNLHPQQYITWKFPPQWTRGNLEENMLLLLGTYMEHLTLYSNLDWNDGVGIKMENWVIGYQKTI